MEVITEAIGRSDKKHVELLPVPLVHLPVTALNAASFEFLLSAADIGHFDGRTVLKHRRR